ncbi:LOW QUALITY PROTEIN: uncharacterized protein [Panulirus ornatus]|uniref:LOW QUALITY PROTEIN: uncharacterized protein n=1 Tax=Panulirus ornatus TaxID=150431 RepID=UPI003A876C87
MDAFALTVVILVCLLPTVAGTDNVTSNAGSTATNWPEALPTTAIQPLHDSPTNKMARATTENATEEGVHRGAPPSSETVRRSIEEEESHFFEDEELHSDAERQAGGVAPFTLKQMALDKALSIQGRSTADRGLTYCDEFIASREFYIHSPSYPENYPNNTVCRYQIYRRHPDYCGVVFTVLRLDLATRPVPAQESREVLKDVGGAIGVAAKRECPGDTLLINGVTHCGRYRRGRTATFLFPSSLLTVEFRSRDGHGASGFLLQGRQVKTCRQPRTLGLPLISSLLCDKRVEGKRFLLQSPGYPAKYRHNLECRYSVVRQDTSVCGVQLTVESFSVENGSCMFDYLEVQRQRLCGVLQPGFTRYYEFEGNDLSIRYRTDESTTSDGFSIVGQQVACDGPQPRQSALSQSEPGTVDDNQSSAPTQTTTQAPSTSPEPEVTLSSSENQSDVDINYILSLIGRQPISIEGDQATATTDLEEDFTELDPGLVTDDGANADQNVPGDPDFNPFTGTGLLPTLPTIPGSVPPNFPTTVNFPATSSFPTPDGSPTTTIFPVRVSCDNITTAPVTRLSSPNYPSNYQDNTDCTYIVGRFSLSVCKLQVNFLDVDISPGTSSGTCTNDYLDVDGTKFCGAFQNRVVSVNFPDQVVTLTFHSDGDGVTGRGFLAEVTQVTTGCGTIGPILPPIPPGCDSVRQEAAFLLLSPGYPARYPPSTDCTTTILKYSPDVTSLVLELVDFEMATTTGCSEDYLEVAGQRLCGTLSGSTRTFPFVGNSLTIKFHSDSGLSGGRGYRVKVGQSTSSVVPGGCGGFVTTTTASLQSPNYPNQYPPDIDCRYIVTRLSADVCQLKLKVLDMDVESSVGCGRDYLQVGMQERLCGQRNPGEIRKYHFSDGQLDLFFHSDGFGSGRGFSIEVTQVTCGYFRPVHPTHPSYRPHHHHHRHHRPHHNHRPVFVKPIKPVLKPNFRIWRKFNPFPDPRHRGHHYTGHYTGPHITDTSHSPPGAGYASPSTSYGHPHTSYLPPAPHCTTHSSYLPPPPPITPRPTTTPRPIFPSTSFPTFPPTLPTILPTVPTFPTTQTPFPTVTSVFSPPLFPTPLPELRFSPSLNASAPGVGDVSPSRDVNSAGGRRQPKTSERSCRQEVTGQRFTIQSPGYPGPYYTSMSCHYAIIREATDVCGVELLMDQFDVEETPGCVEARLVVAQRRYCGSIAPGSHSVVPFPPDGSILMEFVAGRFRSGAGFSLRGRQIPCSVGPLAAAAVSGETSPGSLRQDPEGATEEETSSLRLADQPEEAEWLDQWAGREDIVLPWVGPGGRQDSPRLDKRGWNPL